MKQEITPEDIDQFLKNSLRGPKADKVAAFLGQLTLEELEQYLPDTDFYEQDIAQIPSGHKKALRRAVRKEVRGENGYWKKTLLVAASMVGFMFLASYLLKLTKRPAYKHTALYSLEQKKINNNTGKEKYIHLPDGSGVMLKPGARLTFMDNFMENRFLYMDGMARFDVKHDARHPFIVIANGISTLDLGTSFWVNSDQAKQEVRIQLLEGSIAVKSMEDNGLLENIHLRPGQQILIRKNMGDYLVSNLYPAESSTLPVAHVAALNRTEGETTWNNAAYRFSKSSLRSVFDQLEVSYQVQIEVNPALIQNSVFTGKILYTDSLNTILDAICTINHLSYERIENKIKIRGIQ